ncbi:hypothetical protein IHE44_0003729 [Lamprotornis superbus]|uniref:SH2 domain-containing protein n=1 Tax=Lamprotornis superbus TaxID=245042 RepID=A0A835NR84_9PASS|nr:hypothetical protein IHE44_0003729 [Lamprotornis superbus]
MGGQFLDRGSWRLGKEFLGGGHAEGIHGCAIGCEHSLTALGTKPTMDLRNVPYRSDVLAWDPDDLAEYFRTNMSENDIQKFPKLRVPWVFKRNQSGPWPKHKNLQTTQDDDDDYESPDEDQEKEDEADYESPTEEPEEAEHDSDGYEPPPSNNEEAHHNVIFPAKSLPSSTDYIDLQQPDHHISLHISLQYHPSDLAQPHLGEELPAFPPPPSNDLSRDRNMKPLKPPSIDRSTKPSLDRLAPPYERESPGSGKKPGLPEKPLVSQLRSLGEQLAMMPKPPVPPSDRYERGNTPPLRKQSPGKQTWPPHKKNEEEEDTALQRPVPQLSLPPYSSNAFPPKSVKPPPKPGFNSIPAAESARNLSSTGSLKPPRFHPGSNSRSPSRGPADMRPPLPIPSRQTVHHTNTQEDEPQGSLKDEWYVAFLSRPEAEAALRRINKDGTFLVRDSSRKTVTHPYVLMVLYRDKVYNIQIRYQEQDHLYLLGTSLKGKENRKLTENIIQPQDGATVSKKFGTTQVKRSFQPSEQKLKSRKSHMALRNKVHPKGNQTFSFFLNLSPNMDAGIQKLYRNGIMLKEYESIA